MTVLALMLAGWALLAAAPETPVAAWLRRWTVEAPARRLLAIRPATIIAVALMALLVTAAWAFESEGLRILASAAPEAATWLSMVEVGTLVDAAITAVAARTALRVSPLRGWLAARRPRARRTGAVRVRKAPANDDEERWRAAA